MTTSYRANQDITLYPELTDGEGGTIAAVQAQYDLHGRDGLIVGAQPVDLFGFDRPQLVVPAVHNALPAGETIAYRRVEIAIQDENGKNHRVDITYFIKAQESLTPGVNSFATLPDLLTVAVDMVHLTAFHHASEEQKVSALIQAWNNLGQLPVRFDDLEGTDSYNKGSTRELIDADIGLLQPKTYQRLLRAQVIEADDVLGGNPIEARRRLGLISDSAGESAHFFRTSKPLNLPCCRGAIDELRGIVSWGLHVRR